MSVVIASRTDLTAKEVADALRAGLGRGYTVSPGVRMPHNPLGRTRPANPDMIMVARGAGPLLRAQVEVTRPDGRTELHVTPGGLTLGLLTNTLGIVRTVHDVLQARLADPPSP